MAIEIVVFPIKNGDFPWQTVSSPEGKWEEKPLKWRLPSGYVEIAIENGHRNSEFSHEKWWIFP